MRSRWMSVVVLGLVCAFAFSGCMFKKKKSATGAFGGDNIGGVSGTDVYSENLGDRFATGVEVPGQFMPVYFDYDSSQIRESERGKLNEVASYLNKNAGSALIVEGHCDERGSAEYNLALGERRAMSARAYLVGLGIDAARIQTKSYGEERTVCAEHDEGCWSRNRRGEFVLVQ